MLHNNFRNVFNFNFSGGIVLSDKSRVRETNLTISSQSLGNNVFLNQQTVVPITQRRRIILRAGYMQYSMTGAIHKGQSSDYIETESGDILIKDGIKYHNIDYENLDGVSLGYGRNQNMRPYSVIETFSSGWLTNTVTQIAFVGIESESFVNYIAKTDKMGTRVFQNVGRFYADFMYGVTNVSDITFFASNSDAINIDEEIGSETTTYTPIVGSNTGQLNVNNFGVRVGLEFKNNSPSKFLSWEDRDETTRLLSLGFILEGGILPGIRY
ncbi:MAG: hypothetical protein JJU02_14335 [Cryomorphaceae bacterium]|nr:hypothetical protein [Cryomorphaceae bacterium]